MHTLNPQRPTGVPSKPIPSREATGQTHGAAERLNLRAQACRSGEVPIRFAKALSLIQGAVGPRSALAPAMPRSTPLFNTRFV